jgi:hypothetical protein
MGEWRGLHNKELHDLYYSPGITRIMKSMMKWVERVARIWGEECVWVIGMKPGGKEMTRKTKTVVGG